MQPMVTIDDPRLPARFWSKIAPEPNTGCWLWTAAVIQSGYGVFGWNGRSRVAHHVAYEALVGPIPPGTECDHLCRTRCCVNPGHIEPVTHRENQLRGETFSARGFAATSCPAGHPYDEANTLRRRGWRECRECARLRKVRTRERSRNHA